MLRYLSGALGFFVFVPILGAIVALQAWQVRHGAKEPHGRQGTWYWRIWWWYGYNGLYQIDWWLKATER